MIRIAPKPARPRALAALLAATLALAACSGSGEEAATGTSPGTGPARSATPEPLPLLEGPIRSSSTPGEVAPDFEARVLATGLDEATASFLAQTRSTVDVFDGHTYVVRHAFPNGATGESTYHLFAPTTMSPSDPPRFVGDAEGDAFAYTMSYAIDTAQMPADIVAQIENGLPTAAPVGSVATSTESTSSGSIMQLGLARSGARVVNADDGGAHTLGVVVDGVISQGQESSIDAFVEASAKRGFEKTSDSWDAYKSGKKVWEAVEANEIIATAHAQLDALEKCAKNPTAGVTQQEYKKNPAAQQKALQAIAQARLEIRASTAVLFTSLIADVGSALVQEAPWLGFIVSPAVNYTKDSQMAAIASYVENAAADVVPCAPKAYKLSGKIPSVPAGIVVTGTVCSLEREFVATMDGDYIGRLTFTPAGAAGGSVKFRGKVGNATINVSGHGDYSVSLADDASSGALDFPFTSTIKLSQIPSPRRIADQTATHPVHLTLTETTPCPEVN